MGFSEKINEYIERSQIPHFVLANLIGTHKRTFDRGQTFLIKNSEKYKRLCSYLSLTRQERDELDELYIRTQFSDEDISLIEEINDFIVDFDNAVNNPKFSGDSGESVDEGSTRLLSYIDELITNTDGECHIDFFMDTPQKAIIDKLSDIIRVRENVYLDIIVSFADVCDDRNMRGAVERIHLLTSLLRFPQNIQIKYVYADASNELVMPATMIIGSTVMVMDNACKTMLVERNEGVVSVYKQQFDRIFRSAEKLFIFYNVFEIVNLSLQRQLSAAKIRNYYELRSCCSMYKYVPLDVVGKYIREGIPGRDDFVEKIKSYLSVVSSQKYSVKTFFTLSGIKRFLYSGETNDLPREVCREFDREDKCYIIEKLISDIQDSQGNHNNVIKEKLFKFSFENQTEIVCTDEFVDIAFVHPEYQNLYIRITEKYFREAFAVYFKHFEKSRLTYSKSEAIACLRRMLEEYRRNEI